MSALLNEEQIEKNLAIIVYKNGLGFDTETDLAKILIIGDQLPDDFYLNPIYDQNLDRAIAETQSLVYTIDETGEKAAKSDATSINKFATLYDKFISTTFKRETEQVATWRDGKKAKTKRLLENRQRIIDQFAEQRAKKLEAIRSMLADQLTEYRQEIGVKSDYFSGADITPMVKLTGSMTDGGKLTKSAVDFLKSIATSELSEQNRIEARALMLENRCLKEGINPPLSKVHFGTVFFAEESIFAEKLEQLIVAEIERKVEMEERIRKQQEAENERKLAAALKAQQDEANRVAFELVKKQQQEAIEIEQAKVRAEEFSKKPDEPVSQAVTQMRVESAIAEKRKSEFDQKHPNVPGKRTVTVCVDFRFDGISETVTNAGVAKYLIGLLPEKLQAIATVVEAK